MSSKDFSGLLNQYLLSKTELSTKLALSLFKIFNAVIESSYSFSVLGILMP